jgi:DNA recombination protein RmuC
VALPEALSDPLTAALGGAAALLALLLLLRAAARAARGPEPDTEELFDALADRVEALSAGQHRLAGALGQVAEAQLAAQTRLAESLGQRLERVEGRMGESLSETAERTAHSLGDLGQRLERIGEAQGRIEGLSGDLHELRRVLANKQTRGQFGEIQLMEIVARALPPDAWRAQATLSNGRRADCLILLDHPPGPIAVDSKFPLEAYEAMLDARSEAEERRARSALRRALVGHIRAIAERYVIEGETADSALMFLPSEAVYAALHAEFAEVVRSGFEARVWIVSPTTLMAVLNTMRGVMRDARIAREGARIRGELAALSREVERIGAGAEGLERSLRRAEGELAALRRAAERAGARATRLEAVEFCPEAEARAPCAAAGGAAQPASVSAPETGANPSNSGGPR